MIRHLFSVFLFVVVSPILAQVNDDQKLARPVANDPVQGGWSAADLDVQTELWARLSSSQGEHAEPLSQLNHFRSQRNATLARNQGVIPAPNKEELERIATEIEHRAPNSFEAHMANYYLEFPAPSAYMHLDLAMAKDRERPELVGPMLGNAVRKGIVNELRVTAREFKQRGEVADGLWHLADDILLTLETDAVLITAGEMDTYPLLVRQYAEGHRQDVLVVDQRSLVDRAYRQRVWEKIKARGIVPEIPSEFLKALPLATQRPVYYSLALGPEAVSALKEQLYIIGMVVRHSSSNYDNIQLLERNWKMMHKSTEAGPLARNYLLPGSVLLLHYRSIGDERNAALMEHELRVMARALGASDQLYRSGVFQH